MTNSFPAGIIFWMIILLIKEYNKESSTPEPTKKNEDIGPIWHVQHFSNGRLLNTRHLFYYCDLLNLSNEKHITNKTIENAADNRYALINKIDLDENWPIATRDVIAAKSYLIDRWYYMNHLN